MRTRREGHPFRSLSGGGSHHSGMSRAIALVLLGALLGLTACGGSSKSSNSASAGALSAEAKSAATGDIPDNQVFLTFRNRAAGYSISYPEGWARTGSPRDLTFRDKNNIVHITVASASQPTPASMRAELAGVRVTRPPRNVTLKGRQ